MASYSLHQTTSESAVRPSVAKKAVAESSKASGHVVDGKAGGAEPQPSRAGNSRDDKKRKRGGFGGKNATNMLSKRDQVSKNRADKRRKLLGEEGRSYMSVGNFTAEEIQAEERRPKRKAAVLIGYAGTGYHGLQINHRDQTIEGEIFAAMVKAGAISKVNADDPQKSSLVRCARTDKGVHAAGNVLSLKMIVEDGEKDLVEKLNGFLPPQIRVWGIRKTNRGFSAYQMCESRWYEYLLPSYALLPPHPLSFIARKIAESTEAKGVVEEYNERLDDVAEFWEEVQKNDVQPFLDTLEPTVREEVLRTLNSDSNQEDPKGTPESKKSSGENTGKEAAAPEGLTATDHLAANPPSTSEPTDTAARRESDDTPPTEPADQSASSAESSKELKELSPAEAAVRAIKASHVSAKRRYRISQARIQRFQKALHRYVGTFNFHNYTVLKSAKDPSARRHMKSFEVNPKPIQIRDTEWLSLKVHGQSFMMHQIRKMVAMAVMVVRCGAPDSIMEQSYGSRRISIPKAPGLGLLLERPMFTQYNKRAVEQLEKKPIDFAEYEEKIQEFKDREIYSRMFEVEERENAFHAFFHQLDNFRTDYFLWVTAGGLEASQERAERNGERKALRAILKDVDEADVMDDDDEELIKESEVLTKEAAPDAKEKASASDTEMAAEEGVAVRDCAAEASAEKICAREMKKVQDESSG